MRARNKLTKRQNGVFVKLERDDHHEIYNESGDESEKEDSEDERLTNTMRDIVAKKDVNPDAGKFQIPSDMSILNLKRSRLQTTTKNSETQ